MFISFQYSMQTNTYIMRQEYLIRNPLPMTFLISSDFRCKNIFLFSAILETMLYLSPLVKYSRLTNSIVKFLRCTRLPIFSMNSFRSARRNLSKPVTQRHHSILRHELNQICFPPWFSSCQFDNCSNAIFDNCELDEVGRFIGEILKCRHGSKCFLFFLDAFASFSQGPNHFRRVRYGRAAGLVHGKILQCAEGIFPCFVVDGSRSCLECWEQGCVSKDEVVAVFRVSSEVRQYGDGTSVRWRGVLVGYFN